MQKKPPLLWIVTEGLIGTENQCRGVAESLQEQYYPELAPMIKRIHLRQPWKTFSPFLGFEQWWSFSPMLVPTWPDILITSGRKSVAPARFIKKQSAERSFTLHIQDPRVSSENFDLVAVPQHDSLRGDNVLVTTASPNRITETQLCRAMEEFPTLAEHPSPRAAVLIGGNSKTHKLTREIATELIQNLKTIGEKTRLMITTSRRTPAFFLELLQQNFQSPRHYLYDGKGSNPYFAFLGYADFIIATNDSASMLSESATTGKPIYMVPLAGSSPKFNRLYNALHKHGALRTFNGTLENWSYTPLNDARNVAQKLFEGYEEHCKKFETKDNPKGEQ